MNKINHFFRYTKSTNNYFQKHGKKYLFGTLGAFAIVKMVLLFVGFFSTLDLGKSSAQVPTVLTKDNIVSMGCATTATYCGLYNKGITSIESDAFVNHTQLQNLNLSYNQLTSVDGVEFPDSLQNLYLDNNQLTSIDGVEFPSSLRYLNLFNNQLTSVDGVEFPSSLRYLNLFNNQLTSLDGVEFPDSLQNLYLDNNQLTSIDGVEFPDSVYDLNLSYNQLTSLDGVEFPSSLRYLNLFNNQLTSVDGVEFPSSLRHLHLFNNQLTSVDGVEFPDSLQNLGLGNNQLTSVDGVEFPDSLQNLYLDNNQLTSLDGVEFPSSLRYLDLSNNQLINLDGVEFPDSLYDLDLYGNQLISIDGVEFPSSLGYLNLSSNCIDPLLLSQEDRDFITARNNNPSWMNEQYVCLGIEYEPSEATTGTVLALLALYGPANKIQALLNDNGGSLSQRDEVFDTNGSRLIDFSTIVDAGTNLRLNNVQIWDAENGQYIFGDKELMATVDRIFEPGTLTKYNLVSIMGCATTATYCDLYNKGITSIESDAFVNHTQLQNLGLGNNQLTSVDGVNFPNSLTDLELSNNQLTSVDRVEFPDSLQSLYLSNNQLTSVDRVEFPDSLQSLYLSYNQLTSVDGVEFPSSLRYLDLSNNQLINLDRVEFPDSLQELDLSRNPLTSLDGVEFPNSLGYLGLSNNCIDPLSLSQEDRNFITTRNYNNPSWMNEQYVCLGIEYNPSTSTSNPVTASLAPYGPANKIQALLDDNGGSLSQRDEVFDINGSRLIDFSTIVDTGTNLRLNNVPIGYDNNLDPIYGDKELMATVDRIITRPSGGGGGGWRTPTPTNPEKEHGSASGEDEKKDDDDFETKFNELVEQINQTDANKYPDELLEAYAYSYLRGITTMSTIEKADMYGLLTRIALAKMMSNYVLSEGLQELDTSKECKFPDVPESLDSAYDNGMTKACQLGLMGVDITKFNPYKIVSRAEFATVLSRALRGAKYNGGVPFYTKHLQALKDKEIMTKIENPEKPELRAWTMLMLMRTRKSSIK